MTLEQVNDMASGRFSTQPGIIVTNSPLVIKAFKLHGDHNPRAVSFFCVQWVLNEQKETDGEYVIYASNKLDCIPCPPLGWEDMQTQDIHRARHHSQPIPSYAETLENQP